MSQLHLRDSRGEWYIGMDANRALYAVLGYRRLVRVSLLTGFTQRDVCRLPVFFARRRIRLGQWWEKRQVKS